MLKLILILFVSIIVVIYSAPVAKEQNKLIKLLNYKNEPHHDGSHKYKFGYEISDGQKRHEEGHFIPDQNGRFKHVVNGTYQHVAPNGNTYVVKYTADENGYHPETMIIKQVSGAELELSPNALKSLIG